MEPSEPPLDLLLAIDISHSMQYVMIQKNLSKMVSSFALRIRDSVPFNFKCFHDQQVS